MKVRALREVKSMMTSFFKTIVYSTIDQFQIYINNNFEQEDKLFSTTHLLSIKLVQGSWGERGGVGCVIIRF